MVDEWKPISIKHEFTDKIKDVCFELLNEVYDEAIAIITAVIYTAAKDLASNPVVREYARKLYFENC
jgi:hypothetical protein